MTVPLSSSTGREKRIDLKIDILLFTSVVTVDVEDVDLTESTTPITFPPITFPTSMMLGGW